MYFAGTAFEPKLRIPFICNNCVFIDIYTMTGVLKLFNGDPPSQKTES